MPAMAAGRRQAGLLAAVLTAIEQVETGQRTELQAPVDLHVGTARQAAAAQRHVLVERLVGRRAALEEILRIDPGVRRPAIGVVVLHLMIVPGHGAWRTGMQRLQIGVALVLRIAAAIAIQITGLGQRVGAQELSRAAGQGALVDVVAQEKHQVRLFGGQMAISAEIPQLPVRARDKAKTCRRQAACRRRGPAAPYGALFAERLEAIPIRPAWLQAGHFDMHRVRPLAMGDGFALGHHVFHGRIRGHFPAHRHGLGKLGCGGQARCQAGPDDKTVRPGITTGHA